MSGVVFFGKAKATDGGAFIDLDTGSFNVLWEGIEKQDS